MALAVVATYWIAGLKNWNNTTAKNACDENDGRREGAAGASAATARAEWHARAIEPTCDLSMSHVARQ